MNRRGFIGLSVAAAMGSSPFGRALAELTQVTGDVAAVRSGGGAATLSASDLQQLKDSLRGALLLPGNPGYDQARRVLNEAVDKHPALVVQPTGAADVRTAVNFAREHDLLLAVKCGGHSYGGTSTCDGGMQIDLSRMRGARVDPLARRAYVAGGSLLGDLDHEAMALGLVTTAGTVSHTGVGGLTLGGGFGRLARRFGLAVDNLLSVDVVTADGQMRHASIDENPDLFWGVRGGGGNFGIVTAFEFQLHPMQRQVIGGALVFPLTRARELLAAYAEISAQAPAELYLDAVMSARTGGKPGVFVFGTCFSGAPDAAERALGPLRRLGTPMSDMIKAVDYVALQRSTDQTDPRGEGRYLKSGFVNDFPAGLVDALVTGFRPDPERNSTVFFQHCGGKIGEVTSDATAFPHRRCTHNMFTTASWPLARDGSPHVRYVQDHWKTLEKYSDGWYSVEVADEPAAVVERNYQSNLGRLQRLKDKYDPQNLFRLNANVKPTSQATRTKGAVAA
ncbi:MAG TPA: FAD-binding oxidoreductase [Steroidobacteraceae bacterium]|nr:FAD-binding oxidoreductase [Steroidobacteraceae bacterium]